MGIGTFIKDNIGVVSLCFGVTTIVGGVMTFVFPPTGILLVLAAAGVSCGVALTVVTGYSWIDKQNKKEPVELEDNLENINSLTEQLQTAKAEIEMIKNVQQSETEFREKISQDVKSLEEKTDKKANLIDNSMANLKKGQIELTGKSRSTDSALKDLQSQSQKSAFNTNSLFFTPLIPSDSSHQSRELQNQFI